MKRRAATDEMRTWLAMLVKSPLLCREQTERGGRRAALGRPLFCLAALRSADFQ